LEIIFVIQVIVAELYVFETDIDEIVIESSYVVNNAGSSSKYSTELYIICDET